ncbi:MAG TPA: SET domain-containing protein-lysine N-methyltransferase [Acidimicrobiales bacterium]|nr:SET domain-containing protein-lysine N-methyltransferase [Acidimicrobiales bacterium]
MSSDTPLPTPWLDPSVTVGDSPIAGRGLFATEPIETGRVVVRLGGRLVSSEELAALLEASDDYVDTVAVFDDMHLVLPPQTAVHYGNHSCDPNLWHAGPYAIAARRPIAGGEELTVDYGTQTGAPFSMVCACGAPSCRGVVTGEDWRIGALQEAYTGHWTPVLARRIECEVSRGAR